MSNSNPEWKSVATVKDFRGTRSVRYRRELHSTTIEVFLDEATGRWFHRLYGTACTAGPFSVAAEAQNSAERHAMENMLHDLETLTGRTWLAQPKEG